MSEGMYFSRLAVLGINKRPAEILLTKGLNVIAGSSDTGKSYILECLNYLVGGKDPPKKIEEANGYQKIQGEIRTFNGKTVTLSRRFNDNKIFMAECPFEEFENSRQAPLSSKHSEFTDNISMYLLTLLDLNKKEISYNVYHNKKNLSFRDLARLCLVKEDRIITEKSPIYENIIYDETESKSVFKLFLTGYDDKESPTSENQEHGKSRIKGKIELIKADIDRKTKELTELRKTNQQLTSEEINVQIQKLLTIVEDAYREILEQEKERAQKYQEIDRLQAIFTQNEELKKRFGLLNQAYSSDLARLEFINEGKSGLDQLKEITCPLCEAPMDKRLLELQPHDEMGKNLLNSIRSEYTKIARKQEDLVRALKDIEEKIAITRIAIDAKTTEFKQIDEYILNKLKPVHKTNSESLDKFMKLRDSKAKAVLLESQIIDLNNSLVDYGKILEFGQDKPPKIEIPLDYYIEFSRNVQDILSAWNVKCDNLVFDKDADDIIIDGKRRGNFGKGYRAIFFSSFMLGLLQHSLFRKSGHPRFLALDSPLTTYKPKDGSAPPSANEMVPSEICDNFFQGIANLDYLQRIQVIILDNREPPEDVRKRINYIHFSKSRSTDPENRYGFFPV